MKSSGSFLKKCFFLAVFLVTGINNLQAIPPTNKGNDNASSSCFLNATIQALFHLKPFREFLEWAEQEKIYADDSMPKALIDHIKEMAKNTAIVNPSRFRKKFASCSTNPNITDMAHGQHDAEEFYSNLVEQLWIEHASMKLAKEAFYHLFYSKLDQILISRFWSSLADKPEMYLAKETIKTRIIQNATDNKLANLENIKTTINEDLNWDSVIKPFEAVSIFKQNKLYPLFGKSLDRTVKCLIDPTHFQVFNKIETNENTDFRPWLWPLFMANNETTFDELIRKKIDWKCKNRSCPAAAINQTPTEELKITAAPDILTFQFKRFISDDFGRTSKINRLFIIPEKLSSNPNTLSWDGNFDYLLSGIVMQSGSLSGGHYWAYARWHDDNKWYFYDDCGDRAREATDQEINDLLNPKNLANDAKTTLATPYLLFYVKTNQPEKTPVIPDKPSSMPPKSDPKPEMPVDTLVTKLTDLAKDLKEFNGELTALEDALTNLKTAIGKP